MEFLNQKQRQLSESASTQKYVDVEDVRDGVIVLRNGALRAVLLASSINFDLKSSDEQDAIIIQYQNFLNSLDFPLQIVVRSRRFDIAPYLRKLEQREKTQENELLRFQISEYAHFVESLTEISNIMSKSFYVIVPFAPSETEDGGLMDKISGIFRPARTSFAFGKEFETYRNQLFQRVEQVSAALSGTGVRTSVLNTGEIIELLYNAYNPSMFASTSIGAADEIELAGR